MRLRVWIVLLAFLALALVGCGSQGDQSTPVACLEPQAAWREVLRAAPGAVRFEDGTAISECLPENQEGGELATVGETMVGLATALNAEARAEPGGEANVALGYLLGAATEAAETTEGIHAELVRRLTVAARFAPADQPLPATFLAAYKRGFDAGHADG